MATRSPERGRGRGTRDDDDQDDDAEAGEYTVAGEELKKLVRLGRKRPMPFAFCPSAGEDESLFATHRKKPAKKIARATREASGQTRVAWGTFVIADRVMILTCQRELPSIAKKLKKHMRAERLALNIRVLDASGREIESDIEDLSAEEDLLAGDDDDEDGAPAPAIDRGGDHFRERLAELAAVVEAVPGERGERARDLLGGALRALENGSRDKAQQLAGALEAEVRRLMNTASRPAVRRRRPPPAAAAPEPAPEPPPEPPPEPLPPPGAGPVAPSPETRRLAMAMARRISALRPQIAALEDPAAARLMQALALVARQLRAGAPEGAAEAIDRIEAALARVEARAKG